MSLLDKLKENMTQPAQAPQVNQTSRVRDLLAAKSGKAGAAGTGGPKRVNTAERAAVQQTQAASKALQQQGAIGAEQLAQTSADIEQNRQHQLTQQTQTLKEQQSQFDRQSDNILNQFERGQKSLQNSKDIQELEQLGFQARLESEQYVNQLQLEGDRLRLDDSLAFKTQLAKEQWSSNIALFQDKIKVKEMIDADNRTFLEEVSKIDINSALEIAEAGIKQANIEAQMGALGNIASSAVSYGASSGWFSSTPDTVTDLSTPKEEAAQQSLIPELRGDLFEEPNQSINKKKKEPWEFL